MTNRNDRPRPGMLSLEQYLELAESYGGFCTACGEPVYGVEPDAHDYCCEACGEEAVFGAEELLLRGDLLIHDE